MNFAGFSEIDLLISPEELVVSLGRRMDALWKDQPLAGNKIWTTHVKSFLVEIAKEVADRQQDLSIEVLYTNPTKGLSEFLLDVVWWCRRGNVKQDEFLALAVEVEWGSWYSRVQDCVGEDFGKLTVVKSPLKLMIFCTDKSGPEKTHTAQQQTVLGEIDRYLTAYAHHLPGEHYVLMDVASDGHRGAWLRSVNPDGVLSTLSALKVI